MSRRSPSFAGGTRSRAGSACTPRMVVIDPTSVARNRPGISTQARDVSRALPTHSCETPARASARARVSRRATPSPRAPSVAITSRGATLSFTNWRDSTRTVPPSSRIMPRGAGRGAAASCCALARARHWSRWNSCTLAARPIRAIAKRRKPACMSTARFHLIVGATAGAAVPGAAKTPPSALSGRRIGSRARRRKRTCGRAR